MFEHAEHATPRVEHGYCTDDVARALVALLREPERPTELERLAATCFSFVERAQLPDGRFHNRLSPDRRWLDDVGSDDCTGRALLGLATAARRGTTPRMRSRALHLFETGSSFRSPWPRASALGALAAVELLAARPDNRPAWTLLEASAADLGAVARDPGWPWPEPRLTYANALLADARIAAGEALGDRMLLEEGLDLLGWLVETESRAGHLSFTPVGGWSRGEPRPAFDQQPIEAGTMAEACARAFDVTGDGRWATRALSAAAWFAGRNDNGACLLVAETGGCRDGLEPSGCNENQGAESTLAAITALQHARRLAGGAQRAARRASTTAAPETVAAPMQRSAAP